MIRKVRIENLRGIAEGELDGLAPLTILTGPNGCGKSTVLDALMIAAAGWPSRAIGRAVDRHPVTRDGAQWLVRGWSKGAKATLTVTNSELVERTCTLRVRRQVMTKSKPVKADFAPKMVVEYSCNVSNVELKRLAPEVRKSVASSGALHISVYFDADNYNVPEPDSVHIGGVSGPIFVIDSGLPKPLAEQYSNSVREGRRAEIAEYMADVIRGARALEVLSDDGVPSLYVIFDDAPPVPVSMAGDGVQAFLQLAVELAQLSNGIALVEEPEVYQHPRALRQTARALVAAMRRDVQVVMTTHSLELIDAILATVKEEELEKVAFFSLVLDDGKLKSSRFSGVDGAFARDELDRDLR